MRIGLLQCDHINEQFRHIAGDYPELFRTLMAEVAPEIELIVYDVCHGELPESLDECTGYMTTGSKYSVYDEEAWIRSLEDFVRRLNEDKRKFVGVCFGHQMIAQALGGRVAKSVRGWGIGVKTVEISDQRSWMRPEISAYKLLVSHQDQIAELPEGAEVIGGNEHCPVSMLSIGDHFLGIQAHPEFTLGYAEALMLSRVERIGIEAIDKARETLRQGIDQRTMASWITLFFKQA